MEFHLQRYPIFHIKTMALKTFVKAAGITNLTDARYCAGMGVDLLGFQTIEGRPNHIPASAFQEIRGWVTGPGIVAEAYGLRSENDLAFILEQYRPDYIELGVEELKLVTGLPLPLLLSIEGSALPDNLSVKPAYIICTEPFETEIPLLLWVRSLEEAKRFVDDKRVGGIVLQGGAELRPGLKESEVLNDVLEFLEEL